MSDKCHWCGDEHKGRCPQVKAIEYFESGEVKRVEFTTNSDYFPLYTVLPTPPPDTPMWDPTVG